MIHYLTGDATSFSAGDPKANKILAHICNNEGGFGSGIAGAIAKKWSNVRKVYQYLPHVLETNQLIKVEQGRYVCNMVAQDGYSTPTYAACDLKALRTCLWLLANTLSLAPTTEVHTVPIGCGLGGRDWKSEVEPIVQEMLIKNHNFTVYVYDLK